MSGVKAVPLPGDTVKISTNPHTEPFWEAAKADRLTACQCAECGHFRMPPTPFCPECQSTEKAWPELSGKGSVYSFAVIRGFPGLPDITVVGAVIALPDAGSARLVTNIVDVDPDDVEIGMEVEVDFSPIADGWKLPVFRVPGSARG